LAKLLDVDTVEQKWKIFKTTIHQLVLEYVPLKKTYKKKKSSWIQNATVKMTKTRNTAWKKYRTYPSERNFQEYKHLRNAEQYGKERSSYIHQDDLVILQR